MGHTPKPHLMLTVHGIRTDADNWGDKFRAWVKAHGGPRIASVINCDWGWIDGWQMYSCRLIPFWNWRRIGLVDGQLRSLVELAGEKRVSVIAHSFGTYLILKALWRDPDLKIDALVLVGAVLPNRYEGSKLQRMLNNHQIGRVLVLWSPNDSVIENLSWWPFGKLGWTGFVDRDDDSLHLRQIETQEQHSTYFWSEFRDHWFRVITEFCEGI